MPNLTPKLTAVAATVSIFAGMAVAGTVTAPMAIADVNCGSYTVPGQSAMVAPDTLIITTDNLTCREARRILTDVHAGKGTSLNRQSVQLGKYTCTGSTAGYVDETGIDMICVALGIRFELRVR